MREKYLNFISNNRDTITKILSLIIAILLWYFIITEIDPTITKDFSNVEVELRNQTIMRDAGMDLLQHKEYTTNIVVSGKRSAIIGLNEEDISAYVDLGELEPGTHRLPIHYRLSDDSLTIEKSNPTAITVSVDEMETVKKPVTIRSKGKPREHYVLDRITVNPEMVMVTGPKRQIDKIQSIIGYVPIDKAEDTVVSSADLSAVSQDGKHISGVKINPERVDIQAVISKAANVPINVVYTDESAAGFQKDRAILTPSSIVITGSGEQIDQIKSVETQPIDPRELMDVNAMPVSLVLPEGVHLVNPDESVMLRYLKNEMSRRKISVPSASVDTGKKTFDLPDTIDVDVYGNKNLLESIRPEDIEVTIDANGKVSARCPKGIEVIQMTPERLKTDS
ncbi:MAG: CdaR family protein [Peptoniphilus sp.]|nr:CdaR family protein [Peptoniphilus sp.]MDD7362931.1 CdaR family protein [Bacillota bacterium]MDY6044171.1 CdaR family protein [Peptoniphilus sp.]